MRYTRRRPPITLVRSPNQGKIVIARASVVDRSISMRYPALLIACLMTTTMALSPAPAMPAPPSDHDAGLTVPFDSPQPISGRTLSVLDYGATPGDSSNNDATAIQSAISTAVPGDKVYIPDGIYHVRSTVNLKTGVSVVGQSRDGTVLAGAYRSSPHAMVYAAPGVNNLTLSSFTITMASGRVYSAGVRLGDPKGIQVSRIAVSDLLVEKHERFGIELQNAYHVLVDGNSIKNASALDGGGSGYGVHIDQSGSNNNWVKNNAIGPVIRHAVVVARAHHNLIENNTITGAVSGAIDLHGEDEYSNEIRYNKVSDCVRNGTTVSPNGGGIEVGERSIITGTNILHDNSGPNNWIHHNEVYNCTYGLRIINNSNNTYIEDNVFHDNDISGIQADPPPLRNLYIMRNEVYGNGSGIVLLNVTQATVQENSITNNRNFGIQTNGGVTGYVITDNTVTDNKVNVVRGSQDGIYSEGAS